LAKSERGKNTERGKSVFLFSLAAVAPATNKFLLWRGRTAKFRGTFEARAFVFSVLIPNNGERVATRRGANAH
jgi:hypothetical protein